MKMLVVLREVWLVGGGVGGFVGCSGVTQSTESLVLFSISSFISNLTKAHTHGIITQCRQKGSISSC